MTEFQLAESLRAILDATPDAILVASPEGRVVWCNTEAERMFGYEPGSLLGEAVERLMPEELRDIHIRHRRNYMACPTKRGMGRGLKLVARRKDGVEFRVEIALSPLATPEGPHVVVSVRDLSEFLRV